jgi:hypothetical protein
MGGGWRRGLVIGLVAWFVSYGAAAEAQTVCVGDCNDDGFVFVNELVSGVNIALDRADLDTCPSFDANDSGAVEVNELVTGVNNALVGCPMIGPSPTPSDTMGPTETPTSTPTSSLTATATVTVTVGTATPTDTVDEETPTPTIVVGTSTPTGTVTEETPTPTIVVGTSTPTGTVEEETPTPTIVVGTATPTGTVIEATPTQSVPPAPSATPTATSTPVDGSPTVPPAARIAGSTTVVVNSLGTIPTLISAIANGIDFGGASGGGASGGRDDGGIAAAACPGGGTATRTGNLFPNFNLDITLNACRVPTTDGFVTFNGRIVQSATVLTVNDGTNPTPGPLTAQYEDGTGMPTLLAEAQVTLTVVGLPALGGDCEITAVTFTAAGTIATTTSAGDSSAMTFMGTTVAVDMIVFSPSCVPTAYRLTFTGNAALLSSALAEPIDVTFSALVFDVLDTTGETEFTISGGMSSPCFGGAATISTQTVLAVPDDEVCPTSGQITATGTANATRVIYNSDQSVGLDTDNDGTVDETFPHCQDPRLYQCLA